MVEAVEGGDPLGEIFDFDFEVTADKAELPEETSVDKKCDSPLVKIDNSRFYTAVREAVCDSNIAQLIVAKLKEKGLDTYEKYLGHGAFGNVFQLEGTGAFEGKKLALKLLPYHSDDQYYSYWGNANKITEHGAQGDAIALQLPKGHHLSRAYAILTFDGNEVHYLEEIDPQLHKGHVVVGILSRAIQGGTLGECIMLPMDDEAVRGYGKQLAEALHSLHQEGFTHGDLHTGNILVKAHKMGKSPYRIKLTDFGLAEKISTSTDDLSDDWNRFGWILGHMALDTKLEYDPDLHDLLLDPDKGLIVAEHCFSDEAILNHPFFV